MSAFDETVKFLKIYYSHLFEGKNDYFEDKPFFKKNNYWLSIFINDINMYGDLNKLLLYFLKIKNKKILEDFKKNINKYQILDIVYKGAMGKFFIDDDYEVLKNLIFLGSNVNSDLLLYDINTITYLKNSMNELEKIKNKNYVINKCFEKIKKIIIIEELKIKYYNLIYQAYYAQKINRFIKYYYDDKYRLTKFRLKIEENKYLRISKDIPGSS